MLSQSPCSILRALDGDVPTVEMILNVYSGTYGGASNVHMDARYYAEPTTMFREASGLRGANLVKGNTPYPIFLPYVVRSLVDAYRFYSGSEQLKRLGADLSEDGGNRDKDNHGEWGLIPSSLDLVVLMVLQGNGMGASTERKWRPSQHSRDCILQALSLTGCMEGIHSSSIVMEG